MTFDGVSKTGKLYVDGILEGTATNTDIEQRHKHIGGTAHWCCSQRFVRTLGRFVKPTEVYGKQRVRFRVLHASHVQGRASSLFG